MMKKIKKGFVYSEDIKRILEGVNAFDYSYDAQPTKETIESIREDLKEEMNKIFNNQVTIVSEEEMLMVNNLISGDYTHCNIG